jgi:hypothetical protein
MAFAQLSGGGPRVGTFQVEDHHFGALLGHHASGGKTQTIEARTACDDGNLVFQQHVCLLWVELRCEWREFWEGQWVNTNDINSLNI